MKNALAFTSSLLALAVCAAPASAGVTVEGTGEPQFTNSAQNTQFVRYQVPSGTDGYRLRYDYSANNAVVNNPSVDMPLGGGVTWANWSGVANLQHGGHYGICVQGSYSFPNDSLFFPDGPNSCSTAAIEGKRASTTIDRSKPTINVTAAGGAAATKSTLIDLHIDYTDDVAPPFPGNFICAEAGTGDGCAGIYAYSGACSLPNQVGKVNSFDCKVETSGSNFPDGPVKLCTRAADAAIPDNPSNANQSGTPDKANLSDGKCDTVILDRSAPAVTVNASTTTASVGQPVAFTAQASDAASGLAGTTQWSWGYSAPGTAGDAVMHTFTQPGTYAVEARIKDVAGNEGVATRQITVTAPSSGSAGGGAGSVGGAAGPAGGPGSSSGDAAAGGPSAAEVAAAAGGGATQRRAGKGIRVLAPKRIKAGRRSILLGVAADKPGKLSLGLVKGKRTFARAAAALKGGPERQRLSLPRSLRAGKHVLKVSFKPKGTRRAVTLKLAITVVGAAKASASAASHPAGGGRIDRSTVPEPKLPNGRRP